MKIGIHLTPVMIHYPSLHRHYSLFPKALRQGKADSKQLAMSPPAAKRQRSIDHMDSTRNISVVKGGLSIMCPSVSGLQVMNAGAFPTVNKPVTLVFVF